MTSAGDKEQTMRTWEDYKKTMQNEPTLWSAARENDLATLGRLLARGADVEAKDHRGYSPLMLAAYSDSVECVSALLSWGADPDSRDAAGNTVLMGAAFKGNLMVLRLLIKAGADVSAVNATKMDAYDFAVTFGRTEAAALLQEHGIPKRRVNRVINFARILASRWVGRRAQADTAIV